MYFIKCATDADTLSEMANLTKKRHADINHMEVWYYKFDFVDYNLVASSSARTLALAYTINEIDILKMEKKEKQKVQKV